MSNENCAVILAGGQGKRMKSTLPKPMFEVLGEPMLEWVIKACEGADMSNLCVVTGFNHEVIEDYLGGRYETVFQPERMGTGHAVIMAREFLRRHMGGNVLILNGDAPFIDSETIKKSLELHERENNAVTVITAEVDDPKGYGRIIRGEDGIRGIVEENDASVEQKKIREINSGAYWFNIEKLIDALGQLKPANSQREYYLTDTIFILISMGFRADAYISENSDSVLGANDRKGLLMLNNCARYAIINKLLDEGVEFVCTDGVSIGRDVKVGRGTKILQGCIISGNTEIGENCVIGPNCIIDNCTIGENVTLNSVQAHESQVKRGAHIGPFVQLRPGCVVGEGVKIGDFVEIKNSNIGDNTAISHLTYVGDSDVGSGVNIGCGVATCNYDGEKKFRTQIGDNAFIGCNTNLVAPVKIGNAAYTGAGTTVTEDVPDGALVLGRPDEKIVEGFGTKRLASRIEKAKKSGK